MPEKLKLSKSNFSEWYDKILFYADIVDDRFPLKGVWVWKPFGYKAIKLMINKIEDLHDQTGHQEAYFPIFAPLKIFEKEKDFLAGMQAETLKITKVGETVLDEELVVRPTSETIMYQMFSLWVRSWRDLPIKIYQIVPVFRWETKMTKALLRVREIIKFKEAHTVHATKEGSEEQIQEGILIYKKVYEFLKIPNIVLETPSWDTFPGAICNYDFFTVLPDGKAVELGSVINLGQKFAKAFDIKFKDKNEKDQYVWQTCYGLSERSLGACLALHGDNKGLIFPSEIAPVQVVIIPIREDKKILKICQSLTKLPFRTEIDSSDKSPGEKFFHWEAKGVPVRLEIGPKDLKTKSALLVRRDTGEKKSVKISQLTTIIPKILNSIDENLSKKADKFLTAMIKTCKNLQEAKNTLAKGGIVKLAWCGEEACGKKMEQELVGKALGFDKEKTKGKCTCRKPAKVYLHFAKTY